MKKWRFLITGCFLVAISGIVISVIGTQDEDKVSLQAVKLEDIIALENKREDQRFSESSSKHIITLEAQELTVNPAENTLAEYINLRNQSSLPKAQYSLYKLLNKCTATSARTQDQLEELITQLDHGAGTEVREIYEQCSEIYLHLKDVDIKERSLAWLESAADEGYPLAKVQSLYAYPELPSQAEMLPLLYESLRQSNDNPELRGDIYTNALYYYADYLDVQPDAQGGDPYYRPQNLERDAWEYLSCFHTETCNHQELIEMLEKDVGYHEATEVLQIAASIEKHIHSGDFKKLNLDR